MQFCCEKAAQQLQAVLSESGKTKKEEFGCLANCHYTTLAPSSNASKPDSSEKTGEGVVGASISLQLKRS